MLNSKARSEVAYARTFLSHTTGRQRIETSINCIDDIKWTALILRELANSLDHIVNEVKLRPAYIMSLAGREIYAAHRKLADVAAENNDPNVAQRWDSNIKKTG